MTTPIYPHIEVDLDDGNAYAIMGKIRKALIQHKLGNEWDKIQEEMKSGDYDNLIAVAEKYVTII